MSPRRRTSRRLTRSNPFHQVQHLGHCCQIFFTCSICEPLHFHVHFPTSSLCSSISAICSVPINTIHLLPLHHLRTLRASHQRINVGTSAIDLSLDTFFGIKKNIVVHACCGHLPLCSTFTKNSTSSFVVSCAKSRELLGESRHIPLLSLPCTISTLFSLSHFLALAALPPIFSAPHFAKSFPPHPAHLRHTASVLPSLSSWPHNGPAT